MSDSHNSTATLGQRLSLAMKRAAPRLSNQEVAEAVGVHVNTVSYWRSDKQKPEDTQLEKVVALLRERGVIASVPQLRYGDAIRGLALEEGGGKAERLWLARFRADLISLDATNAEVGAAEALVQAPEAVAFCRAERLDATPLDAMRWLGRAIHDEVARRHGGAGIKKRSVDELARELDEALARGAPDNEVLALLAQMPADRFMGAAELRAAHAREAKGDKTAGRRR